MSSLQRASIVNWAPPEKKWSVPAKGRSGLPFIATGSKPADAVASAWIGGRDARSSR